MTSAKSLNRVGIANCSAVALGRRDRLRFLCLSEIMTILIGFAQSHYHTFKHYYLHHVCRYWRRAFPTLVSYQHEPAGAAAPCHSFLRHGIDPSILFIASRNVLEPGPKAAAYSVAKAGLTQLARVAALELAPEIRVNVLHPDCVYDTGIWTPEVLVSRAERYGISVDEYKSRNLLKQPVSSEEVAQMVCTMASKVFGKTTGAQVPIDGGAIALSSFNL